MERHHRGADHGAATRRPLSRLFDGSANFELRLGGPRVTLMARARESHESRHHARFLARHAEALTLYANAL